MPVVFNPPPGWPSAPVGWVPSPGWLPDPSWPAAPPAWQFWTDAVDVPDSLPASAWAPPVALAAPNPDPYGSAAPLRPPWLGAGPTMSSTPTSVAPAPAQTPSSTPQAPTAPRDRTRLVAALGWGGLAVTALAGLTSGIGGALLFAGLFAFVVALVAMIRGRVGWAHLPTRAGGAVALVGAVVAVAVGTTVSPAAVGTSAPPSAGTIVAPPASSSAATTTSAPRPSATHATSPAVGPSPTPETDPVESAISAAHAGSALALVGTLTVQGRGPMTGYSRADFGPAWTDTDRNGCDPRIICTARRG